jgi:hypothetical protein
LSLQEKEYFLRQLVEVANLEKDLENIKIEVALKQDYNLIDAFGLLD